MSSDEHVPKEEEVTVPLVLNCTHTDIHRETGEGEREGEGKR